MRACDLIKAFLLDEKLSKADRAKLPATAFVFPDRRAFPIHDLAHAKIALQYARSGFRIKAKDAPTVIKAVLSKYPELKA